MYLVQAPTAMETLSASLYMSGLNWFSQSTEWSREENKKFERALAIFDEWEPNRWLKVAAMIPGKTVDDVKKQYKELEEDVSDIEAGKVPIPGYHLSSSNFTVLDLVDDATDFSFCRKRPLNARTAEQQRKKGVPWTEEEHRRFLLGLLKHGKGDWRNISRNFVVSKTPTQVASHAQKYFIRQQLSGVKDKRRPSIHDITTINLTHNNSFHPSETDHRVSSIDQQDPAGNASQVLLEMNDQLMNGSIMLFDSTHGDLFVSSPNYGTKLGRQKNLYAFDMPSTRHQIHG